MPKAVVDLARDGIHACCLRGIRFSLASSRRLAFDVSPLAGRDGAYAIGVGIDAGGETRTHARSVPEGEFASGCLRLPADRLYFFARAHPCEEVSRRGGVRCSFSGKHTMQATWGQTELAATLLTSTPEALLLELLFAVRPIVRTPALAHLIAVLCVVALRSGALDLGVVAVLRSEFCVLSFAVAVAPALVALLLGFAICLGVGRTLRPASLALVIAMGPGVGGVTLTALNPTPLGCGSGSSRLRRAGSLALTVLRSDPLEVVRPESVAILFDLLGMLRLPPPVALTHLLSMRLAVGPPALTLAFAPLVITATSRATGIRVVERHSSAFPRDR